MKNRAVFLDRDNTLIEDPGYISDPGQVRLMHGVTDALRQLGKMDYKLIVITNQSGIARGYFDEVKLKDIHNKLEQLLWVEDVSLDGIYYCPYHPEGVIGKYRMESELRKPNPGMLLKAAQDKDIDLSQSWMIGDSERDIQAGQAAGCKTIFIEPSVAYAKIKYEKVKADYSVNNLKEAVNIIKSRERKIAVSASNKDNVTATSQESEPVVKNESNYMTIDKDEEKMQVDKVQNDNDDRNYLREIHQILAAQQRQNMFSEFSSLNLIAGIIQMIVVFLALVAIWLVMKKSGTAYLYLQFAILGQLITLTLFMMQGRK